MSEILEAIDRRLSAIEHGLATALQQWSISMSQSDDLLAAVAALKSATDNELTALNTIRSALEGSAAKSDPHVTQAIADIMQVTDRLNNAAVAASTSADAAVAPAPADPAPAEPAPV